ncbi:MAG: hypothetical protein ACOYB3_01335 [Azonexus sp.]
MCGEPLVARRCQDRVWHWAHKPHTNQKQGTCLFDDSPWSLKWRLGYLMFPGWEIEKPRKIPSGKTILIHSVNPTTKNVREFIGHINEANEDRFQFLLGAQNHNVVWMLDGKQWARALAKKVGDKGGIKDLLKPKAQALYERICAAGQNALVHIDGPNGGTLYKEWTKVIPGDTNKPEHTGIWFPLMGDRALAVLDNYSRVTLPYDNAKSESTPKQAAAARFDKMLEVV